MYARTFFDSFIFNILIKRHDLSCFSQISVLFSKFLFRNYQKNIAKVIFICFKKRREKLL